LQTIPTKDIIQRLEKALSVKTFTLGELVEISDEEDLSLSSVVVAEALNKIGIHYRLRKHNESVGEYQHELWLYG